MHRRHRALLILALCLASGAALAQGFGFGFGFDDRRGGQAGPPAVVGYLLLVGDGNILLVGGGKLTCDGPC